MKNLFFPLLGSLLLFACSGSENKEESEQANSSKDPRRGKNRFFIICFYISIIIQIEFQLSFAN